jgi:hypothetical protein
MSVSFRVSIGGAKCSDNEAVHFGSSLLKHYDWSTEGIKMLIIYFRLPHLEIIMHLHLAFSNGG